MVSIISFVFEDHLVRVIRMDGEPWFLLVDVCRILSIRNARDAAARLDEDEIGCHYY